MAKETLALTLVFLLGLMQPCCGTQKASVPSQYKLASPKTDLQTTPSRKSAPKDESIQRLISSLSSEDGSERTKAQIALTQLAQQSSENRKAVIDELIASVNKLGLEDKLVLEPKVFQFWQSVTRIFGELRATETVDLLIAFIYCSDGLSDETSHHRPAEDALIDLGADALPKLSEALLHNENRTIRKRVALCLGNIGGTDAKRTLEAALQSENDSDVRHYIEIAIRGAQN